MDETTGFEFKRWCVELSERLSPMPRTYKEVLDQAKQLYREVTEREWGTPPPSPAE